ncbi:FAD-binding protein [Pseudonocardiaceae bacterium YIM PH 21723]|nr:FAD-binding protein [Pseudonocardiaceae bacterium YIM PH 21723]
MSEWQNWAGTATAAPADIVRAHSVEQIVDAVRDGRPIKALGSGHSFTSIGAPEDGALALDLREWAGIESVADGLVTVRSGTTLNALNHALDGHGLAMTNMGDIDKQTIAGAVSTGTHGTGARSGGIATQIRALELVTADGRSQRCSATENPELFDAARVGLGALGVITRVTLACEPGYLLRAEEIPLPLNEVLAQFDERSDQHDHVEFYWLVHTGQALLKTNDRLPAGTVPQPLSPIRHWLEYDLLENTGLGLVCRIGKAMPSRIPALNRFLAKMVSPRGYSDVSHRVFVTDRRVKFTESEYAVPREALHQVLTELRLTSEQLSHPVSFPVEVRTAAADDIWLSTAHGRDSAYIAIHQYKGLPYEEWFAAFEKIVGEVGGRPHWGKMHSLDATTLCERYPRFDDFRGIRNTLDPDRRFTNGYLRRVLGD